MYSEKNICNRSNGVNLLDLPEITFRMIFQYLDDQFVYLVVFNICRKIRNYVENYMQLGDVFLDVHTPSCIYQATRIFYVFKKHNEVRSIYCTTSSCNDGHLCFLDFGEVTPEKAVMGWFSIFKRRNFLQGISLFGNNSTQEELVRDLCEIYHRQKTRKLMSRIVPLYRNPIVESNNDQYRNIWRFATWTCICPIGQSKILLNVCSEGSNKFLLIAFKVKNVSKSKSKPKYGHIIKSIKSIPIISLIEDKYKFEEMKVVSIIQISPERVLIIGQGGQSWTRYRNCFGSPLLVWKGSLMKNKLHLELLKETDTKNEYVSVCFNMGINVYIVRGQCCDMFNIEEKEYYENVFSFPYIMGYRRKRHTAITDVNGTFVMILLEKGQPKTAIMFTESGGFKDISVRYNDKCKRIDRLVKIVRNAYNM